MIKIQFGEIATGGIVSCQWRPVCLFRVALATKAGSSVTYGFQRECHKIICSALLVVYGRRDSRCPADYYMSRVFLEARLRGDIFSLPHDLSYHSMIFIKFIGFNIYNRNLPIENILNLLLVRGRTCSAN